MSRPKQAGWYVVYEESSRDGKRILCSTTALGDHPIRHLSESSDRFEKEYGRRVFYTPLWWAPLTAEEMTLAMDLPGCDFHEVDG